jgi:glutamyl/glutaminyl-tRNA synthetase
VNFLALLGWSTGDDRELLTRDELIASFSLEQISGGNAVFDIEKLDWMNGQYIARMPVDGLARAVAPFLEEAGLRLPASADSGHRLLDLLRPRAKRLIDFVELARPFLVDTVEYEAEAVEKHLRTPDLAAHIMALIVTLRTAVPFDEPHVEAAVRGTATERGLKAGALIHATRVAVTGRTTSPGLFEVLALLGPERTRARLERLVAFLQARA